MFDKKLFKEIAFIAIIGIAVAIAYNIVNPKKLPFIPKDKAELIVSDSLLFGNIEYNADFDSTDVTKEEYNPETLPDTIVIAQTTDQNASKPASDSIKATKTEQITLSDKTPSGKEFKLVTFEQMRRIIESTNFVIIDARQPEDYAKEHIPGAINIFPYSDESEVIPKLLSLPREKTIVIYCDGGNCDLSHEVANLLVNSFGFTKVYLYEGGWDEWSRKIKSS